MSFLKAAKEIGRRVRQTSAARRCAFGLMGAAMVTLSGCGAGWVKTSYYGPPPENVDTQFFNYDGTRCTVTVQDDYGNVFCADNRDEDRYRRGRGRDHHHRHHRRDYDYRDGPDRRGDRGPYWDSRYPQPY